MGESMGKIEETEDVLTHPRAILKQGRLQKSIVIVLAQLRSKPSKPDTKAKNANALKSELQQIRKQGLSEQDVLPKSIHDSAIKAIASGGAV